MNAEEEAHDLILRMFKQVRVRRLYDDKAKFEAAEEYFRLVSNRYRQGKRAKRENERMEQEFKALKLELEKGQHPQMVSSDEEEPVDTSVVVYGPWPEWK